MWAHAEQPAASKQLYAQRAGADQHADARGGGDRIPWPRFANAANARRRQRRRGGDAAGGGGGSGSTLLQPLDAWHSVRSSPSSGGVCVGLLHAGRSRRREQLLADGSLLPLQAADAKGGTAMQQRRAVVTTIWSFVATAVFAFGFVLPYRGRKEAHSRFRHRVEGAACAAPPAPRAAPSPRPHRARSPSAAPHSHA